MHAHDGSSSRRLFRGRTFDILTITTLRHHTHSHTHSTSSRLCPHLPLPTHINSSTSKKLPVKYVPVSTLSTHRLIRPSMAPAVDPKNTLTDRERELMALAWLCFSEKPKVCTAHGLHELTPRKNSILLTHTNSPTTRNSPPSPACPTRSPPPTPGPRSRRKSPPRSATFLPTARRRLRLPRLRRRRSVLLLRLSTASRRLRRPRRRVRLRRSSTSLSMRMRQRRSRVSSKVCCVRAVARRMLFSRAA